MPFDEARPTGLEEDPDELERQLERRRAAVAVAWGGEAGGREAAAWGREAPVVLVRAGERIGIPGGQDLTYPFHAHSEYLYLTDRNRPGGVLAFDPASGWADFVAPVTVDEMLWSGTPAGGAEGRSIAELGGWLAARAGRPRVVLGVADPALGGDERLAADLRYALDIVRRPKDPVELARMRFAARATAAGYAAIRPFLADGVSERTVQTELEAAFRRAGGDGLAYDPIVGAGPNAAILHGAPSERPMRRGELVLIDAGAGYRGYVCDVTRTYPVDGECSDTHRELHALVLAANRAVLERCAQGVEFRELHYVAALVIAAGLVDFGILRGDPETLFQSGAVTLFFPHGVGHMVGLGVRDAGGRLRGREADPPGYPRIRVDLPLEIGHVITVEPGLYFVPALLTDPERRAAHRDSVAWDEVDALLGFGGVRIEDNVLITGDGHEVLTAEIPIL